jgi:uncharacterized membrane protein YdjX (TVP38/TMEM64 family)
MSTSVQKLGVVVLVLTLFALAYHFGIFSWVSAPRSLARRLVEMGVEGYVVFVVTYAVLQPFGVPGTVFIIAAPLIWPWKTAFALSMAGTMGASVIGFSFARFVARDWVAARIPARFRKYDHAIELNGFRTVFFLRLIFWMPQLLHSFLGVSKVSFSTHFWASLLGYVPPLFVVSYLGSEVFDGAGNLQPRAWPALGGLLLVSLALLAALRYYERRRRTAKESLEGRGERG